jgi:hypothetical protein
MYVSGALLLLASALSGLLWLAAMPGPGGGWCPSFPLAGLVVFYVGVQILFGPMRRQLLREKRLIEYKVFASPDRPPPVEIPRPPDMVFLSAWFGAHSLALSLVLPLVASLLFVMVFGAAAVVCGVIALSQAHLRGLIGMGLGVVSVIVWGLVFVYFLQG